MLLHRLQEALQHGFLQACALQQRKATVGRGLVHQSPAEGAVRSAEGCMGAEELPPAVRHAGMRVHDAARQLHKLADMPDDQKRFHPLRKRDIDGISKIVGAFDHRKIRRKPQLLLQKVHPVVARHGNQVLCPGFGRLPDFNLYGVNDGLFAHRFHNAGCAEDGDPALNAQHRVEGLLRSLLPFRNGDHNIQPARIARFGTDGFHGRDNHLPRNRVDGSCTHRLIQPLFCDAADSRTAVKANALPGYPNGRDDEKPVRHIRVVPGVLPYRTDRLIPFHPAENRLHLNRQTFRGEEAERRRRNARQEKLCSPGRGKGGARPRCEAAAQHSGAAAQIMFQSHLLPSRFSSSLWRRDPAALQQDTAAHCRSQPKQCFRPFSPEL